MLNPIQICRWNTNWGDGKEKQAQQQPKQKTKQDAVKNASNRWKVILGLTALMQQLHPQTVTNDGSQSLIKIKYFQNFGLYIIYVLALYF
jgi:hypothetical protein